MVSFLRGVDGVIFKRGSTVGISSDVVRVCYVWLWV